MLFLHAFHYCCYYGYAVVVVVVVVAGRVLEVLLTVVLPGHFFSVLHEVLAGDTGGGDVDMQENAHFSQN